MAERIIMSSNGKAPARIVILLCVMAVAGHLSYQLGKRIANDWWRQQGCDFQVIQQDNRTWPEANTGSLRLRSHDKVCWRNYENTGNRCWVIDNKGILHETFEEIKK
jgi:hypothetical protein